MKWQAPRRFSREWWLWVTSFGLSVAALVVLILVILGRTVSVDVLLWIGIAVVASELLLAVTLELAAPTRITVGPGERFRHDDDVESFARVENDFNEFGQGKVRIGGELWSARRVSGGSRPLRRGDTVAVVDREGLVLVVDSRENGAKQ